MKRNTSSATSNTRFTVGGTVEMNGRYLGWWERTPLTFASDDIIVTLNPRYDQRPDLLAYDIYGKETYAWLVLQYNNIIDVVEEFTTGTSVRLPSQKRLQAILVTNNSSNIGV
jgi:hypothetical protein